jgi:hypothetical protein
MVVQQVSSMYTLGKLLVLHVPALHMLLAAVVLALLVQGGKLSLVLS